MATLRDHLASQDGDAAALFSRGAKIGKRANEPETKTEIGFVPVRIEDPVAVGEAARCRFRHAGGHVVEFTELPEVTWLAALFKRCRAKIDDLAAERHPGVGGGGRD